MAKSTASLPAERIILIDLLRSLSILLVLGLHLGTARFAQGLDRPVPHYWNVFARNGAYGVSLFFIISGFLITRILMRTRPDFTSISFADFYARRAGRILPLLAVIVLVGVFCLYLVPPSDARFFCFDPGASLKGVLATLATFSFNWYDIWNGPRSGGLGVYWGVLWSLSIEEQFYLFYPLLLRRMAALQKITAFLLGVFGVGFLYRAWAGHSFPFSTAWSFEGSFGAFDQIAAGCLLYFITRKSGTWMEQRRGVAVGLAILGGGIMTWTYLHTNLHDAHGRLVGPSLLALGCFLFLWGGLSIHLEETFPWKVLCFPGQLSYGIYLLHSLVLFLGWSFFRQANPWAAYCLFVMMCTLLAYASYTGYELPANRWIRAKTANLFK